MNEHGRKEKTEDVREIRKHAEELALEMNLRLICEMPLSDKEPLLWVESICVTDIVYPQPVPEPNKR
jgi:hypothetical protein